MEAARRPRPFHLCLVVDELPCKAGGAILQVDPFVHAEPPDLERHDGRDRRRATAENGIDAVVKIKHRNVGRLEYGITRSRIDAANGAGGNPGGPEETAWLDPGIEVDDLQPRTGVVDVDSYQGKVALTRFAIDTAIHTLHESHV